LTHSLKLIFATLFAKSSFELDFSAEMEHSKMDSKLMPSQVPRTGLTA
jgi:hypothetical protein